MSQLLTNYYEAASVILFGIGFMNLLLQRNLIKKFIGLNIMDTATYLFLAAKGYVAGRTAPILTNGIIDADYYINPIPAGLVLTGIVVSVSGCLQETADEKGNSRRCRTAGMLRCLRNWKR